MSNIKKCLLIFMNFWTILCKINSTNIESNDNSSSCIMTNNHTSTVWQLVWQDQFESESDFNAKWKVHREHILCKNSESCNRRDNVYLSNGYLVMQAKQKRYLQYNYTGARLTSKHAFAEGRYEIRATQPNGLLIRACFYAFNVKMFRENRQLEIMCYQQGLQGNRALVKGKFSVDTFQHFHTYGVEWNQRNVTFFFNDFYYETIMLNESFPLNKKYHLRLDVTIEKSNTKSPVEDFDKMSWRCPAFIVDHVRVYQNAVNRSDLPECKEQKITKSVNQEQEILDQICLSALAKSLIDDSDNFKMSFTTLLGIILLAILLFIVLVSFLFAKYSRMRNRNQERVQNMVQYFIGDIANNKNNYEVPKYDNQGRYCEKKRSYLDLQDGDVVSEGSRQESVLKS